jgi:hypothetical protein
MVVGGLGIKFMYYHMLPRVARTRPCVVDHNRTESPPSLPWIPASEHFFFVLMHTACSTRNECIPNFDNLFFSLRKVFFSVIAQVKSIPCHRDS